MILFKLVRIEKPATRNYSVGEAESRRNDDDGFIPETASASRTFFSRGIKESGASGETPLMPASSWGKVPPRVNKADVLAMGYAQRDRSYR